MARQKEELDSVYARLAVAQYDVKLPVLLWDNDAFKESKFGADMRANFLLDPNCTFLNHGSYGATPKVVFEVLKKWQLQMESSPVQFQSNRLFSYLIRTTRELAQFIGANANDVVFVPNATTATNTVVKSINFTKDGNIVYLSLIYQALEFTLHQIQENTGVQLRKIDVSIPVDFEKVLQDFENNIDDKTELCVVDHISSATGLILPVERLVEISHKKGKMILIDGAHAVGQVPLDLNKLGADFYTSNCHKWLFGPKGTAFLHVKKEHQKMIQPLVASHGYHSGWNAKFIWFGTADYTPFIVISTALEFYQKIGGEKSVMAHNNKLVEDASSYLIEKWKTNKVFTDTKNSHLHQAALCTIRVPDGIPVWGGIASTPAEKAVYLQECLYNKHCIEIPCMVLANKVWIRISGQIYNHIHEYEKLADAVLQIVNC